MSDTTIYLLSWDCNGLESCTNVSDLERQTMWATLSNAKPPNLNSLVQTLLWRARMNTQRRYEIYTVGVASSVTEKQLLDMFELNPQGMAELVRERGTKIYSDRCEVVKAKIT